MSSRSLTVSMKYLESSPLGVISHAFNGALAILEQLAPSIDQRRISKNTIEIKNKMKQSFNKD
jgi:hypothetical protein